MNSDRNGPEYLITNQLQEDDVDSTDEQLLEKYLAMPKETRDRHFVGTASAAEIANVSRRTIELWIQGGMVRAVLVGRKYQVSLPSLVAYLKGRSRQRKH